MTSPMYERVRQYFGDTGLTDGYIVQLLAFEDTKKLTDAFMVFRPNGGSSIRNDLGADYYTIVDVISAKGKRGPASERVQQIIDYVQDNPINDCLGIIENLGNIPAPVLTEEGRLVFRLQFVCVFGE
ncbi:phage tail termination protein [Enterobacter hormaechei]|uniref:phage tail termination protein n=1 Tax=Enterobacter hormaechei TaxID=158836 RepID=UPI001252B5A3|nr:MULTISPECIES: hypothetical protein [Enterobacter]MDU6467419.1 hypothetical protein [Enterobacter sp.]VAE95949.1 Uncharacterised protein [Enterobacter hormaechei]VAK88354.1 Uncharacterised protein [Enterobacter hormaechei]HAW6283848.1 hypothetical protein [Escherichia coli]